MFIVIAVNTIRQTVEMCVLAFIFCSYKCGGLSRLHMPDAPGGLLIPLNQEIQVRVEAAFCPWNKSANCCSSATLRSETAQQVIPLQSNRMRLNPCLASTSGVVSPG